MEKPRVIKPISSGLNELIIGSEFRIGSNPRSALSPPKSAAIAPAELALFQYTPNRITEIEPVTFKAVIPLEPTVNLGEYEDIRVEKEPVEITEEQVNDVLQRLRQESAPWEPVDRAVQYGDLLNITVTGTIDEEQVVNDEGIDYIPQEDNVLPFPGFATNLEGMKDQENKEFTITIPEDYPREQFAGKECTFDLTILSVKEKDNLNQLTKLYSDLYYPLWDAGKIDRKF